MKIQGISKRLLLAMATFMLILGCSFSASAKVSLNKKQVTMPVGAKCTLRVKGAKKKSIKWKSSNKSIAGVTKKGVVTANSEGNCQITAKVGKKKVVCKITVVDPSKTTATTASTEAKKTPVLSGLAANQTEINAGETSSITFTVRGENIASTVVLCLSDGSIVATMVDNGTAGDHVSGDSIYTCVYSMTPLVIGNSTFYARTETVISNTVSITHSSKLLQTGKTAALAVVAKLVEIYKKYAPNGVTPSLEMVNSFFTEVVEYAKELVSSGIAVSYERTDNGVQVKLPSGLTIVLTADPTASNGLGFNVSITSS